MKALKRATILEVIRFKKAGFSGHEIRMDMDRITKEIESKEGR